jgi:hypothetical protein
MYSSTLLCLDQFKNSYRMPWLISPHSYSDYAKRLLQRMELHVDKYGLQNCISHLDSKQAHTFLAEDIRAVNGLLNPYNDHMELLSKYCPTDPVAATMALKNQFETDYFYSLADKISIIKKIVMPVFSFGAGYAVCSNLYASYHVFPTSACLSNVLSGQLPPELAEIILQNIDFAEEVQYMYDKSVMAGAVGGALIALMSSVLQDYSYN